jgi:hypothetical protein
MVVRAVVGNMATKTTDGGRPVETTLEDILATFRARDDPAEPLTAKEVAERAGCSRRTALNRLDDLADVGETASKKVGGRARVWWVPLTGEEPDAAAVEGASVPWPGADSESDDGGDKRPRADAGGDASNGVDLAALSFKRDMNDVRERHLLAWIQHVRESDGGVTKSDFEDWWTDERDSETGYGEASFWEIFAKPAMKQSDKFDKPNTRTYRWVGGGEGE